MFTGIAVYTYIPLLITVAVIVYVFVKVLKKDKDSDKKNNVPLLIAICVVGAGSLVSAFIPNPFIISCFILISAILFAIALKTSNTKQESKEESLVEESEMNITLEPDSLEEEEVVPEEINYDVSLISTTRSFMFKAAEAFLDNDNGLDNLLDHINNAVMSDVQADGAAILLVDDFDDIISVKAFNGDYPPPYEIPTDIPHKILRVSTNFRFAQFSLAKTIFGEVATSGKAEMINDPNTDDRIFKNGPEDFLRNGCYIFVPMIVKDVVIGVVSVARKFGNTKFTDKDFGRVKVLTDFASAAVRNVYAFQEVIEHAELIRESEIACKLQTTLSPKLLPSIPSLSLGCYSNTAEGVCGDYYDIVPSRADRISFVLTDVAGKGMNSLLVMVMIRAIMRLVVNTTQSAGTILEWANRGILSDNGIDHFASLSLINYDSIAKTIQFSSAGTTPIYLYSNAENSINKITSPSEPIGVEKTTKYDDKQIDVQSGDIVITFTDGLVETLDENGNQYSTNKLLQIVSENHQKSGRDIASLVKADVKKFSGTARLHDDQTLIVIKIQ